MVVTPRILSCYFFRNSFAVSVRAGIVMVAGSMTSCMVVPGESDERDTCCGGVTIHMPKDVVGLLVKTS